MNYLNQYSNEPIRILGISGSLRNDSFNTALLKAVQELAPETVEVTIFPLNDVPFYDGDVESQGDPETVIALKQAIRDTSGLIIATPEYNHSFSAPIKNAIDWLSRDNSEGSLAGKPVTLIGAGGMSGTARAQMQLANVLLSTGALLLANPGVFITSPWDKFDDEGHLFDEVTRSVISGHIVEFKYWILRLNNRYQPVAV